MRFNKLIPELVVSDLKRSSEFYAKLLGFKIEYERPEKKFAFMSLQGSQIMIQEGIDKNSPWFTGKLEHPHGRGIHLQLEVENVQKILRSLKKADYPIKEELKEYWFRKDKTMVGVKGFLVMDPDGYLLMFNENIGKKSVK
jgi:lactoylglutathione lyase